MSKSKELKQPEECAVANPASMFAADAGAGMEGASAESFAIPFLMILQKGSPEVDEESGQAIPGAKAGMFFENISRTMSDGKEGVLVVPCAYRRVYLHWSESKGFQGEILPEEVNKRRAAGTIKEHKGKLYVPENDGSVDPEESDRISDTRNHYVLIIDRAKGSWRQALISLSSTQIKKSRALMTALASVQVESAGKLITPPTFGNIVKATTIPESNDKGTWFGWSFELDGFVESPELYEAAKAFHKSAVDGAVQAKYDAEHAAEEAVEQGF